MELMLATTPSSRVFFIAQNYISIHKAPAGPREETAGVRPHPRQSVSTDRKAASITLVIVSTSLAETVLPMPGRNSLSR